MPKRYFYIPLSALTITIIVIIGIYFPKTYKIIISFIMIIAVCNQVVFYSVLLADNQVINYEIESKIKDAERLGLKNFIIFNCDGYNGTVLTNRSYYHADSPFDSEWMTELYLLRSHNFEKTIAIKQGSQVKELDNNHIEIFNSISQTSIVLEKNTCFFTGLIDYEYDNPSFQRPQRAYYYSYEEYKNSPASKNVQIVTVNDRCFYTDNLNEKNKPYT